MALGRCLPRLAAAVVLTAAAASCAPGPPPTPGATGPTASPAGPSATAPAGTASASASPPASPGAGATPDPEGYVPLDVLRPARTIDLPELFGTHRLDSDGPLVVMDQMPSVPSRAVRLLDLSSGASRDLSAAPAGWHAWNPSISGTMVAWIDWRYEEPNDTGALDWRIEVQDVRQDGGAARTVASGVQRRALATQGASWPALDLDGDRLVYAVEDEAGASDGWKVVVQALAGPIADTLRTSEPVFDLAASGGAVAWTQGPIDPVVGYTTDTTLYVARGSPLVATRVASDAYDLALEDGRVAWTQDTPGGRGAAVGSRIWSADVATLTAQPVSPPPGGGTEQRQEWPATGDGIVTWGSSRLSLADPSVNGDRLAAWTPALGRAVELLPSRGAILSGVNGGWVVWIDGWAEPQTVSGATEQSIGLP